MNWGNYLPVLIPVLMSGCVGRSRTSCPLFEGIGTTDRDNIRTQRSPTLRKSRAHTPNSPDAAAAVARDPCGQGRPHRHAPSGRLLVRGIAGDSILESEYILLKFILGQEDDPDLPLIANYLRSLQQPTRLEHVSGGANDLAGTVKAYFALSSWATIRGPAHAGGAGVVLALAGEQCNSFTKFYFAAWGRFRMTRARPSRRRSPAPQVPVFQLVRGVGVSRTMILPLAIVSTLRPTRSCRRIWDSRVVPGL